MANKGTITAYSVETDTLEVGGNPITSGGGAGSDTSAIHDDTAGEISAVAEKATPVSADVFLIEDSADSNNKKQVQIGNLPAAAPAAQCALRSGLCRRRGRGLRARAARQRQLRSHLRTLRSGHLHARGNSALPEPRARTQPRHIEAAAAARQAAGIRR